MSTLNSQNYQLEVWEAGTHWLLSPNSERSLVVLTQYFWAVLACGASGHHSVGECSGEKVEIYVENVSVA